MRQLAALLRIAVALDAGGTQAVRRIETRLQDETIWLRVTAAPDARFDFAELRRKAGFLEEVFGVHVRVGRARRSSTTPNDRVARAGTLTGVRRSPAALPRRSAA